MKKYLLTFNEEVVGKRAPEIHESDAVQLALWREVDEKYGVDAVWKIEADNIILTLSDN